MMQNSTAGKVSKYNKASINVEQCQQQYYQLSISLILSVPERQQRERERERVTSQKGCLLPGQGGRGSGLKGLGRPEIVIEM